MADNSNDNGSDFMTPLFVVFLVLKLSGTIDWSWWLVTAPLWVPLAIAVIVLVVGGIVCLVAIFVVFIFETIELVKAWIQRRRSK